MYDNIIDNTVSITTIIKHCYRCNIKYPLIIIDQEDNDNSNQCSNCINIERYNRLYYLFANRVISENTKK